MFIDSHCHLDQMPEIKGIVERAVQAGVKKMVSASVDLQSCGKNLELAQEFREIFPALGIHPETVISANDASLNECLEFIEENSGKAIAFGETGLDFKYAENEFQKQRQVEFFRKHVALAKEFDKAIIVHSRRARKECLELLEQAGAEKVLMHWFYGNSKELAVIKDNGWFLSLGPSILDAMHAQEFALKAEPEQILLETDAPVEFNGLRSEPAWISKVAEKTAELKELDLKELEGITEKNAANLFGKRI